MNKLFKSSIFWTILIGIIGIVLSIVIYKFSNNKREPVYAVTKEPSLIFDKKNASSKIKLCMNDSTQINENIYVVSLVFWNNGQLEIKKEEMRKDFTISISGKSSILDYKIVKQTIPNIANFSLSKVNDKIKIDWDYFDPKFGCEIQIMYSGNENAEVLLDGYTLGASVEKVKIKTTSSYFAIAAIITILFSISLLILGIKFGIIEKAILYILLLCSITFFLLGLYGLYDSFWNGMTPPFIK